MSEQALQSLKALEQIKDSRGEFIENFSTFSVHFWGIKK